jgi:hypothetical protein
VIIDNFDSPLFSFLTTGDYKLIARIVDGNRNATFFKITVGLFYKGVSLTKPLRN